MECSYLILDIGSATMTLAGEIPPLVPGVFVGDGERSNVQSGRRRARGGEGRKGDALAVGVVERKNGRRALKSIHDDIR